MIKTFDNLQEAIDNTKNNFKAVNPSSNPFLVRSFLSQILDSTSGNDFELSQALNVAISQYFVSTCDESFVLTHANDRGLSLKQATKSVGNIIVTGVTTTTIPNNTDLTSSNGILFTTTMSTSIQVSNINISNIVRSSNIATVTATNHQLATGNEIIISGSDQAGYNGTFTITVLDQNTFTYEVDINTITPSTGSGLGEIKRGEKPPLLVQL